LEPRLGPQENKSAFLLARALLVDDARHAGRVVGGEPVDDGTVALAPGDRFSFAFMTWLIGRRALKLSWEELGWRRPGGLKGFGGGLGFATLLAVTGVLLGINAARGLIG